MRRSLLLFATIGMFAIQGFGQVSFRILLDSAATGGSSPGRGTGYAVLSSDLKTLTYQVTVNKLLGTIQQAHFHTFPGGAVIQAITFTGNTASGTWSNVPDSILRYMFSNTRSLYVNVHTTSNSGGEIRGNLQAQQAGFTFSLDDVGTGTTSTGKGTGVLSVRDSSTVPALRYHITYAGMKGNFTNAHFHALPSGAVIKQITFVDSTADGYWTNYPDSVITLLLRGKVYVNIHTGFNTGGEIRGTSTYVGEFCTVAEVNGPQAGTASTAKGTAWAVLANDLSKIKYSVTYGKLQGAFQQAHFHSSPGGGVVQAITFTGNTAAGDWLSPTDVNIQDFVRGRLYVNIHSAFNTAGEIRGDLKYVDGAFNAKLDGASAGTNSTAKGTGFITLNEDSIRYHATFAGLTGAFSNGHIHAAPSGAVLKPLSFTDSTSAGYWSSYPDSVIYLAVKARLYFNVHSGTFTGGEIRGNIGPGSFIATGVEQISDALPASFKLEQNYPNPFNPSTSINFSVKRTAHVSLKVFNLLGQVVAVLMDEIKAPGSYKVTFDARFLSTGIYFYRLAADNFSELRKMVLLK